MGKNGQKWPNGSGRFLFSSGLMKNLGRTRIDRPGKPGSNRMDWMDRMDRIEYRAWLGVDVDVLQAL